jgi:Transposase IS116/IS110/IS902 family
LTPKEHSTGGKRRMGSISRAGNERLRQLLVSGATAVIRVATGPGNKLATEWLLKLLQRRPRTRRDRAGQRDGADRLGHDEQRRGLPASTDSRRGGFRLTTIS